MSSAAARFELLTLIFDGSPSRAKLTGKLSLLLIGPAMVPTSPLYVSETFWRVTASPTAKRPAAAANPFAALEAEDDDDEGEEDVGEPAVAAPPAEASPRKKKKKRAKR